MAWEREEDEFIEVEHVALLAADSCTSSSTPSGEVTACAATSDAQKAAVVRGRSAAAERALGF